MLIYCKYKSVGVTANDNTFFLTSDSPTFYHWKRYSMVHTWPFCLKYYIHRKYFKHITEIYTLTFLFTTTALSEYLKL